MLEKSDPTYSQTIVSDHKPETRLFHHQIIFINQEVNLNQQFISIIAFSFIYIYKIINKKIKKQFFISLQARQHLKSLADCSIIRVASISTVSLRIKLNSWSASIVTYVVGNFHKRGIECQKMPQVVTAFKTRKYIISNST